MIDVEFDGNDDFDDDGDIDDNCDVDKALSYRRDWMEDDYVRVHSQLNVKSCLLCVFHTSVVTAKCERWWHQQWRWHQWQNNDDVDNDN